MNRNHLSLAIGVVLAMSSTARAQDAGANAPAAQETTVAKKKEVATTLGEVTVTARRREEDAQKVPVAVSTFSDEELQKIQASSVDGLQGSVPNLNIVQGRGSSNSVNVFIRGIGQPDALQTFDPGVGMYVDDVYYSRIQGALFSLFDIKQVEVLRGPQGTLYGKNSTGGAIKLTTREPDAEKASGSAEIMVGNYGRLNGNFYGSMPLGDTVSASLAFTSINSDGYVTDPRNGNQYNEDDTTAGRLKINFHPSEDFSLALSLDYTHQDNAPTLGQSVAPLYLNSGLGAFQSTLQPAPTGEYNFETETSLKPGQGQELTSQGIAAVVNWKLSEPWSFKSITAYRELDSRAYIDIDASRFQLGDVLVDFKQRQLSQEFQLQYDNGSNLQSVFGLYYLHEKLPSHQEAYGNDIYAFFGVPYGFLRTIDDDLDTKSFAVFGHVSWEFVPTWTLSAGIRYSKDEKEYVRTTSTFWTPQFAGLGFVNGTVPFPRTSASWKAWTPSFSLQKAFGDNVTGYVSANRGFKSGGFNGRSNSAYDVIHAEYDPETVWTYELGLKTESADKRMLGNFSVFHSDYKDFQARVSEQTNPGSPTPTVSFPVINAAELTIEGVEFEGIALVGDGTKLSAQVGWMDAKYKNFNDYRLVPGSPGYNAAFAATVHEHVPFSPDWTMRLAASHAFLLNSGGLLTLGADMSYRGDTWLSVDNRPGLMQPDYTLWGVFGIYDSPEGAWQVRGGVRNLIDETYKTDGQEFSSVANIQTAYYGAPRNYYLSLRYNF